MKQNQIIIVTGLPVTGKTTLAVRLAKDLKLPLITRDGIKETLFDSLGWKDRLASKKYGEASYRLMYSFANQLLAAGQPFILESNFHTKTDSKTFQKLQKKYNFLALQIFCKSDGGVLMERFRRRTESGERHPGHVDHLNYTEFEKTFAANDELPLEIKGEVFTIDTTDFNRVDYSLLATKAKKYLSRS